MGGQGTLARNYAIWYRREGIWKKAAPVGSFKPNEYSLFDVPGNDVRIGIAVTETTGCCGADLGPALPSCGWLAAATTLRMMGATSTAFDVLYQDPITPEPHEVRSLQATKERP